MCVSTCSARGRGESVSYSVSEACCSRVRCCFCFRSENCQVGTLVPTSRGVIGLLQTVLLLLSCRSPQPPSPLFASWLAVANPLSRGSTPAISQHLLAANLLDSTRAMLGIARQVTLYRTSVSSKSKACLAVLAAPLLWLGVAATTFPSNGWQLDRWSCEKHRV